MSASALVGLRIKIQMKFYSLINYLIFSNHLIKLFANKNTLISKSIIIVLISNLAYYCLFAYFFYRQIFY